VLLTDRSVSFRQSKPVPRSGVLDNMRHIMGTWRKGPGPGPLALGYCTDPKGRAAGAIAEGYYLLIIDLNIY